MARTYEIAKNPPPAMPWEQYRQIAASELAEVLKSEPAETTVQGVLERHPCLIPGAFGLPLTSPSGHGPFPSAVISKPPLPSREESIPDFMWITTDSVTLSPVLIEIEAPGKRWFTKSGQQTSQLTQALDQLMEWRAWFQKSHNKEAFLDFYKIDGMLRRRIFKPMFMLIYGRRAESNRTEKLATKRGLMQGENLFVVSYDRLTPSTDASEYICVKVGTEGYRAESVPPTLTLGPMFAEGRAYIRGKAEAVSKNSYLTQERKDFLVSRFPYWDEWAKLNPKGIIDTGDRE